jgi:hypothetical protein
MTTAKLHIDLSQGVIEIEGDAEFVREIYIDFKERLAGGAKLTSASTHRSNPIHEVGGEAENAGSSTTGKQKTKRRTPPKKKVANEDASNGVVADAPKLDKNLDTSTLGEFYGQFAPKNNAEKILIFLKFITEKLMIENPNTDQVYTCFKITGEKIPKAFAQAFYDTSSKHGFIDFRSSIDMPITIVGDNHFNHTLKRKGAE